MKNSEKVANIKNSEKVINKDFKFDDIKDLTKEAENINKFVEIIDTINQKYKKSLES